MKKSLFVIMGFACSAFLLACGDDNPSGTGGLDFPGAEIESSSSEEVIPSSAEALSSSGVQSSSSEEIVLSSSVAESSSSSEVKLSSSSVVESSSSVSEGDSTLTYERECDKMFDDRDGRSYCTVKIGTQTWMGENLAYDIPGSKCKGDDPVNCQKFGRLYTYAQAMNRSEDECGPGRKCEGNYPLSPGACPEGWTVATLKDWNTLIDYVGKHNGSEPVVVSLLAKPEDSRRDDMTMGSNLSGFRMLVAGVYNPEFNSLSDSSISFWTATEEGANLAYDYGFDLYNAYTDMESYPALKQTYRSVRCIQKEGGSSSAASSSSEAVESSSSDSYIDPSYVIRDSIVDARDGHVYKTVKIGMQTWMAENLDYALEDGVKSWKYSCEGGMECVDYGRFYTWATAIDSASLASNTSNPQVCGNGVECTTAERGSIARIQGVCPEGWRIPHEYDWVLLYESVSRVDSTRTEISGKVLKSVSGWVEGNGLDEYGFNVLPSGTYYPADQRFSLEHYVGFFWILNEYDEESGKVVYFSTSPSATTAGMSKSDALPVRCIKG